MWLGAARASLEYVYTKFEFGRDRDREAFERPVDPGPIDRDIANGSGASPSRVHVHMHFQNLNLWGRYVCCGRIQSAGCV